MRKVFVDDIVKDMEHILLRRRELKSYESEYVLDLLKRIRDDKALTRWPMKGIMNLENDHYSRSKLYL